LARDTATLSSLATNPLPATAEILAGSVSLLENIGAIAVFGLALSATTEEVVVIVVPGDLLWKLLKVVNKGGDAGIWANEVV
jgi:hypothetical protein